ncbi:MAG: hypothetical protein Q9183_000948 [Haloplaca sp. 2 TL-2023]
MGLGLAIVAYTANGAMIAWCVTMHASQTHALVAHFRWSLKSLLLAVAHACWTAHNQGGRNATVETPAEGAVEKEWHAKDTWDAEGEGDAACPSVETRVSLADTGDELGYCEEGGGEDGGEMDGEGICVAVNCWVGVVGALAGAKGAAVGTAEAFLDVEVGRLDCEKGEEGEGE